MQSGSEKTIRKFTTLSLIILLTVTGLLYLFYHNKSDYTSVFFALDTIVSVRSDISCNDEIKERINELSAVFDNYSSDSEITELNNNKNLVCSDELTEFINEVLKLNERYGYTADISAGYLSTLWQKTIETNILPDEELISDFLLRKEKCSINIKGSLITLSEDTVIDPGSAAKGYVLDKILSMISNRKTDHTIVSTGSSTLLYSSDASHVFNVAVKDDSDRIAGTAETHPCFVSTSGDYERFTEIDGKIYHHIIDTRTGYPADSGLSSVTVFCDSGIMSDFLSTLIFIEGTENIYKYIDSDDFRIIAIDKQGNIYKSDSLIFHESE